MEIKLTVKDIKALSKKMKVFVEQKYLPDIIDDARKTAKPLLDEVFIEAFNRTEVMLGINGLYAGDEERDVQAHLGFDDSMQEYVVEQILSTVTKSLKIPRTTNGKKILGFRVHDDKIEENLLEMDGAWYSSDTKKNGSQLVEWMRWLIQGDNENLSADIIFLDREGLGRSKRAIMRTNKSGNTWEISDYNAWSKGKNFVSDVDEDVVMIKEMKQIITESVKQSINRAGG